MYRTVSNIGHKQDAGLSLDILLKIVQQRNIT